MGSYTRIFRFTVTKDNTFCVSEDRFEGQISYTEMVKVCSQPVGPQMPLPPGASTPFDFSVAKGDADYLIFHCAMDNWHFTKPSEKAPVEFVSGTNLNNFGPLSTLDLRDGEAVTVGVPCYNTTAGKGKFSINLVCNQGDCATYITIDPDEDGEGGSSDNSPPPPPDGNPTPPGGP